MTVRVYAASSGDDVVRTRRCHAAERDEVDMPVGKLLPVDCLFGIV